MDASLVIPTCNRIEELRQLLASALIQSVRVEIIVMDDGSSDATGQMVRTEFPQVIYRRLASGRGPAFQRNRGVELASSGIVFPLDDDTQLVSERTIEQTLSEFEDASVGAVGIPYINVRQDKIVRQCAPKGNSTYVTDAFVGASHAVRRDSFLAIGGYREDWLYMGEEGDLCLRMLDGGRVVRLGKADPILHLESPRRSWSRLDYYGTRNLVLFAWQNVPWPFLVPHLCATTFNGLSRTLQPKRFMTRLRAIIDGYGLCVLGKVARAPVRRVTYRLHRQIKHRGVVPLEAVLPKLRCIGET